MKNKFNFFEKAPKHYPPESLKGVDWEWDERHPVRRFYRQNRPISFSISIAIAFLLVHFLVTNSFISALFSGILLMTLLFMYWDDFRSGYIERSDFGQYWRARNAKIKSEVEHAQRGDA